MSDASAMRKALCRTIGCTSSFALDLLEVAVTYTTGLPYVIEVWTDQRRMDGLGPEAIPPPSGLPWDPVVTTTILASPTAIDEPRRIWWEHVPEGHCPMCRGRFCIAEKPPDIRLEGWMHCWPCCWSVRMRTLP